MVVRLLPGLLAVLVGACLAQDEASLSSSDIPLDDIGLSIEPVVGGKPTDACDWPSTVDVNGCTGTLIHSRVITTAAHCLSGSSAKVTFTAGKGMAGSFSLTGKCKAGAVGARGGGTNRDWGYCVVPEDPRVKAMAITPPLVGCEAERFLKPGATGWVVGFGTTGSRKSDNGIKREVQVKVNKVTNGIIDIGDKDVGACHGDSGGPIYMKLTDGTHDWGYRVFGSTSSASGNCDCTCSTIYVNISQHVKAIEETEKIDVTPCTDADGKWAPGPDCKDFQSDPQNATGTYPMCTVAITRDPIATCGDAVVGPVAGTGGVASSAGAGATVGAAGTAPGVAAGSGAAAGGPGTPGAATAGAAGTSYIGQAGASGATGVAVGAFGGAGSYSSPGVVGTAAGSGAVASGVAGAAGKATGALPSAGGPATNFAPAQTAPPPAKSSGCQAAGAMGASPAQLPWLVTGLLACLGYGRRRQRRKATV